MSEGEDGVAQDVPRRRRGGCALRLVAIAGLFFVLLIGGLWLARDRIADNFIASELARSGVPATYDIVSIGPRHQVLANIVVGDPAHPDLTIRRAEVAIVPRFGFPRVGRITVEGARLYGSWRDGTLSFGALDPLLFKQSGKPPALPDLDIALKDGRALLFTDYGKVGIKAQGEGRISDGFTGILAATAPDLAGHGCTTRGTTLYGKIDTADGRVHFAGPMRLAALACPSRTISLARAKLVLDARTNANFAGVEGKASIAAGALVYGAVTAGSLAGDSMATFRNGALTARYTMSLRNVTSGQTRMAMLSADGSLRAREGFGRMEVEATLEGAGLRPGAWVDRALAGYQSKAADTLGAPLLAKLRAALARDMPRSSFTADINWRTSGAGTTLSVPQARLRGGRGNTLLALSRLQYSTSGDGPARLAGNFMTGGAALPQASGRMEQQPGGALLLRVTMSDYAAGDARLAIPELLVVQKANGAVDFTGRIVASGALPGGSTRNLVLPVSGTLTSAGELSGWRQCTAVRFDSLTYANLTLERRGLTLCPTPGGAVLRTGRRGLRIAAGVPSLDVAGRLGQTPIAIRSGPVGFAFPGAISARQLNVALGPPATAAKFRISGLDAVIGKDVAGTFHDADVRLNGVPLDIVGANGKWRYAGGRLALTDGDFRLEDRASADRFKPLTARDAALTLFDNQIAADAVLRDPSTDRAITHVAIDHDLTSGAGHAALVVDGITFDKKLQPDQLSRLALGVVANARGTVTGKGAIDWNPKQVTSSGTLSSDSLDFAAAFGPVKGASGTVAFTDLLGLTTAPGQRIAVASVNPGIEVNDGFVTLQLRDGQVLAVEGGSWPFMGGTLDLRPVTLTLGASETRNYTLDIAGLDAARFIERMGIGNISATGVFDGVFPIIFTDNGGRIEGGVLNSRAPGGNVSYVGELTYTDLSPIANFAFDALRSLDYRQMRVAVDGRLTGELVTRVRFDGVKQGAGAKRNFLTRRLANLPLQFNVNIRAPFYQLITSIKAMYDPAYVRDPRDLGLVDQAGQAIRRRTTEQDAPLPPDPLAAPAPVDARDIQTSESEKTP